jgi:hypothetical protein
MDGLFDDAPPVPRRSGMGEDPKRPQAGVETVRQALCRHAPRSGLGPPARRSECMSMQTVSTAETPVSWGTGDSMCSAFR